MPRHVITLKSRAYGREEFKYDTAKEARAGFKRLTRTCTEQHAKDGITRTLECTSLDLFREFRRPKPSPYDFSDFSAFRAAYGAQSWDEETRMLAVWEAHRDVLARQQQHQPSGQ